MPANWEDVPGVDYHVLGSLVGEGQRVGILERERRQDREGIGEEDQRKA
jgi:hypothetical protein